MCNVQTALEAPTQHHTNNAPTQNNVQLSSITSTHNHLNCATAYSSIMRELNILRDELSNVKSVKSSSPQTTMDKLVAEIANLRVEIEDLKSRSHVEHSGTNDVPTEREATSPAMEPGAVQTSLRVCAWNCRGFSQALPYIQHLAQEHDVIVLSEHWLWPYELHKLDDIHPDFVGLGISDHRLNAECNFSRGCGGVAVLWRKNLPMSPVHLDSDRIIVIQLPLQQLNETLTIIGVYLPSSDHPLELFREYLSDLEGMISSFQRNGPVVITGDFNAHLGKDSGPRVCGDKNAQGILLQELINRASLYPISVSSLATGPLHTYSHAGNFTTVNYYLTECMRPTFATFMSSTL